MATDMVLDGQVATAKNTAWWLYIIHAVSFVFSLGAFSFIPLIINYVKRPETAGTFVHSHHSWQIRSFWWYLVWMFIGGIVWMTLIGIPLAIGIWCAAWLWKAYRLIKGIVDLNENRPMP